MQGGHPCHISPYKQLRNVNLRCCPLQKGQAEVARHIATGTLKPY
jgi:hypothetical protein